MADKWRRMSEALPPEGTEILLMFDAWVDPVFNPRGIRMGILLPDSLAYAKFDAGSGSYFGQTDLLKYVDKEHVKWRAL